MIRKTVLSTLLMMALVACNLVKASPGSEPPGGSTTNPQGQVGQAVQQTFDAQTQVANAVAATVAAMASKTAEFTLTPSLTPTLMFTVTLAVPMVSVSEQTNCRSGPGTAYDVLGIMNVGETAQVVGISVSKDNWIIKLPSNPAITCWLWGYYATVVGITSGLTVYTPPPTPTPAASFTYLYKSLAIGPGYVCLLFNVVNTGALTWMSYSFTVHDATQGVTGTNAGSNGFTDYGPWCTVSTGFQADLAHGEAGTASVKINLPSSPVGDHFDATLTLCTANGLSGTCLPKTINFILTP